MRGQEKIIDKSDRKKVIESAIQQIEKQFGKGAIMLLGESGKKQK